MSPAPAAVLSGVRHRYGAVVALDHCDLTVPGGCMAGLIGPDGVGKSTLLALIAGVKTIQQGRVMALGGDMADAAHRARSLDRVAYMPQGLGRNLYPTLTVAENIEFHAQLFGLAAAERQAKIADLLAATGLDPFPDRPAGQLSGGMKQKLSLCCALIHDPDLLILDEPTTGVDPLSRRQFWELIDRLRERRPEMSVIVATAYMEEAARFDWLAAIDAGRPLAVGTPAELLAQAGVATGGGIEEAFIALLPPDRRGDHQPVVVPPRIATEGPPAIEAVGLTRRFGAFTAVDHVDFRIERGEIFGFLGSNGCGKSTTMKMLTGLLAASEGSAQLFGAPVDADDMSVRRRVGYMSQAFSLYSELSVRHNLELHAQLYALPPAERPGRIADMLRRFDLESVADQAPESLPLGVRQRLQLAVAVLHAPDMLILDEPTSGVDPIARDDFWRLLISLSRDQGVTLFISTHFMNEAARCDRISLMHAGRVLAVGAPAELAAARGGGDLETAFIAYLTDANAERQQGVQGRVPGGESTRGAEPLSSLVSTSVAPAAKFAPLRRLWACARREALELRRDRLRLTFALLAPMLLLFTFGYGVSFDVENIRFAVFDQDDGAASRDLIAAFAGSRYFSEQPPIRDAAELERRLQRDDLSLVLEIPAGFGRKLAAGRGPELAIWLDGANPFRAETARSYVLGVAQAWRNERLRALLGEIPADPAGVSLRFRYNQAFKSVYAMAPGIIMLMLMLVPAMLTAVAVVREKETGSIANFRSTPVRAWEFLLGKQAPYAAIALVSAALMTAQSYLLFDVGVRGDPWTLALGIALYCCATTGFGLVVSCFTRSQVAAIFASAICSIMPAVNFSGLMVPVASLTGGAQLFGRLFPSSYFQQISLGVFTKGLGFAELSGDCAILAVFALAYLLIAQALLRKQER